MVLSMVCYNKIMLFLYGVTLIININRYKNTYPKHITVLIINKINPINTVNT